MTKTELFESNQIFLGKVIQVHVDKVLLPNGNQAVMEVIRHPGAAAVLPITADNEVILLKQFRYATGDSIYEIPAGKIEPNEAPAQCAHRELMEEAGVKANQLTPMGWIWTTPGFTDEKIHLFAAQDLEPVPQKLEEDEIVSVHKLALRDALRKAQRGEINDAKSVCALLRLSMYIPSLVD